MVTDTTKKVLIGTGIVGAVLFVLSRKQQVNTIQGGGGSGGFLIGGGQGSFGSENDGGFDFSNLLNDFRSSLKGAPNLDGGETKKDVVTNELGQSALFEGDSEGGFLLDSSGNPIGSTTRTLFTTGKVTSGGFSSSGSSQSLYAPKGATKKEIEAQASLVNRGFSNYQIAKKSAFTSPIKIISSFFRRRRR